MCYLVVSDSLWPQGLQPSPLSMGFSRQEYWSGLSCLPPGDLPDPGLEPRSPVLQADSVPPEPPGKPKGKKMYGAKGEKGQPLLHHRVPAKSLSHVRLFVTLWAIARQAPLSMGILQARILEWVASSSSRASPCPRDRTCVSYVSCIGRWVLYHSCRLGSLDTHICMSESFAVHLKPSQLVNRLYSIMSEKFKKATL